VFYLKTVNVEKLSMEAFRSFGTYANLINPEAENIGAKPIEFFRDMAQVNVGAVEASFSTCRVEPRPFVIEVSEYHDTTAEGTLPLDNDVVMYVGPATAGGEFPHDKIRAFHIPQGTLVVLNPGVWHHAVFAMNNKPVNAMVVLAERTYAKDCKVLVLKDDEKIEIKF
jgi:ureidoglycolate lyase